MVQIHLRVDEKTKERLAREAREQDRSETSLIRVALHRYFKELDQQQTFLSSLAAGRAAQTGV